MPRKNPNIFKPAFNIPPKLKSLLDPLSKWDAKASVIENYKACGVVSNPNFLGARSRTAHLVESDTLQMPPREEPVSEFDPIDSGSDLEEDGELLIELSVALFLCF